MCQGFWKPRIKTRDGRILEITLLYDHPPTCTWAPDPHYHSLTWIGGHVTEISGTVRSTSCLRQHPTGCSATFKDGMCHACASLEKNQAFLRSVERANIDPSLPSSSIPLQHMGRRHLIATCRELKNQLEVLLRRTSNRPLSSRTSLDQFELVYGSSPMVKAAFYILQAHCKGIFERAENSVLRSFIPHMAQNLDVNSPNGLRHSSFETSMMLYEVILIKGGRWLVEFVARNLGGPRKVSTITQKWKAEIPYSLGLSGSKAVINDIVRIYDRAMEQHNIARGSVPFMLSEDETCCQSRVYWDRNKDELWNFCGAKCPCVGKCNCGKPHVCQSSLTIKIGEGRDGYERLINAFNNHKIGTYGRVVLICPLHRNLSAIPLLICATCNCFSSKYVRDQWKSLQTLCESHLSAVLGPLLGHASDGDSRRRRLQLEDMSPTAGIRFRPQSCRGFALTGKVDEKDESHITHLHTQDPIHDGKKLLNIIFSASRTLYLGRHLVTIDHISHVAEKHRSLSGLSSKDVLRKDRQNWASAQRLCRSRVLKLMKSEYDSSGLDCLGTYYYLRMVWRFIHIFFSTTASLKRRIFLCSYVIHFLVRWKVWLQKHSTMGVSVNFITTESYTDALITCHQAILLVKFYRKMKTDIPICFEKLGSDCCEKFFSAMGSWVCNKRTYDPATMALQSTKHRRLLWIMNERDGPNWSSKKRTREVWDTEFEEGVDPQPSKSFDLDSVLSAYMEITDSVIADLWLDGDVAARRDLEDLGMKPTPLSHRPSKALDNLYPWWENLSAVILSGTSVERASSCMSMREREARSANDGEAETLDYNSDISVNSDDEADQNMNPPCRFVKLPSELSTSKVARMLGVKPKVLVHTCKDYSTTFLASVTHDSVFTDGSVVPVPPEGVIDPCEFTFSYTDHRNRSIYVPCSGSQQSPDAQQQADDSEGDDSNDDIPDTDGKTNDYLPLPGGSTMIHKATLVAYHNMNPGLSTDRLCRVMQANNSSSTKRSVKKQKSSDATNSDALSSPTVGVLSLILYRPHQFAKIQFGRVIKIIRVFKKTATRRKATIKCKEPIPIPTCGNECGSYSLHIHKMDLQRQRSTISFTPSTHPPIVCNLEVVKTSFDNEYFTFDPERRCWSTSDRQVSRTINSELRLNSVTLSKVEDPSEYVGRTIHKAFKDELFQDILYPGKVVSWRKEIEGGAVSIYFRVVYNDDDSEDLSLNELKKYLLEE